MDNTRWNAIWINASIATMSKSNIPYGMLERGAIAIKDGKIAWVGTMDSLHDKPNNLAEIVYNASGSCITPGLIDCHTHLVYAGNRYHEFVMRLEGASYAEIAKTGGGIRSTVTATRASSEEDLLQQSLIRARALLNEGVTTIEIKSGYGLDLATELKILRVAKRIESILPVTVKKTFLGAHALPPEFQGKADSYIDLVCNEMLPVVAKENLADAVDVFCETIGFTLEQTERVFIAAKKLGLRVKCHAEQLSNSSSATLAAKYQALSVDHLEFISEEGVEAIAKSGTVAVLLPGAFYFLRETQPPPISLLRKHNVPIAIATDCNPGTSPVTSLLLMLNMACTLFKLTPEEALLGITRNAATALGLQNSHGTLEVGKTADFVLWNINHPAELAYHLGLNRCIKIIKEGKIE
jgi:imidazolonepropionase